MILKSNQFSFKLKIIIEELLLEQLDKHHGTRGIHISCTTTSMIFYIYVYCVMILFFNFQLKKKFHNHFFLNFIIDIMKYSF